MSPIITTEAGNGQAGMERKKGSAGKRRQERKNAKNGRRERVDGGSYERKRGKR